ncbi:ABC transporter substrate-binding protein [Butyrivibrio sp. INlla16]|uniref:ABC transporter substrate-binding protein n=1 Tax=Butyrivibrio sp. INlla16 TaxID=1520807 RepID=UPI0008924C31|nr:extracellular solute-binding protein [Butyrivibrio sp. INlla16]SDB53035.1 ABC-type glycerol-3-phosphate transport system, substrate-binding protein [Butyrivibrio sp. INlla16]
MKREKIIRGIAIVTACSMAFLCACGKKKEQTVISTTTAATEADNRDCIYNLENIELPTEGKYSLNAMNKGKDYFFLIANMYDTETSEKKLFKVALKSGEISEIPFELSENTEIDNLVCDNKDNVYIFTAKYDSSDEEDSAVKTNAALMKLSPDGEKIWEALLTEEDTNNYINSVAYEKDKGIMTCAGGNISLYDEETGAGEVVLKTDDSENYFYGRIFNSNDGDVYLSNEDWSENGRYIVKKYNQGTKEFDEEVSLPDGVSISYLYPGESYDFYYEDYAKIEAFNLGDEETTLICDYTSSDILSCYMNYICEAPDGKFYVVDLDENGESALGCMTKVNGDEISDKQIITLGAVYLSDSIRSQVVKFNKNSDNYKIQIVDYGENQTEDTLDAYNEILKQIGLDLTQGCGPDMLVVDFDMPLESYIEKGALEPLDSYFDNDPEVNTSDFLENVMASTKFNDKMYTILPLFGIDTCIASKDIVGDQTVTLSNYEDICKANNMDPQLGMGYQTRDMATNLYSTIGNTFVDYENGTCNFNSEDFVSFLQFMKQFPADDEELGIDYEDFETYYREKKSLLYEYYITSFEDYQILKKGYFGSEVEFNGFPTADGGKSFIRPFVRLAMNHDSKNKEAAWDFMRTFMMDDYQKSVDWGLPIRKSAFEELAAKAQEKPYYIDENGKKVESNSIWEIGDVEVEITELSSEETKQVEEFIESVSNPLSNEQKINDIISEEAGAFYEGQKTAEEVADIIQSRVLLYLSENM